MSRLIITPKYKKSFFEYTILKKEINNKKVKITRELLWRTGEIEVTITEEDFQKFCKDNNLQLLKLKENEYKLFESLKKNNALVFDDKFPFEYEFLSSFDGCSDYRNICYDDGSDVEESIEEEINNILEEGDFYDLEDNHGYCIDENFYEIIGGFEIQ